MSSKVSCPFGINLQREEMRNGKTQIRPSELGLLADILTRLEDIVGIRDNGTAKYHSRNNLGDALLSRA